MINDNTIISSFNDRPTLLEWLKKVEEALKTDTATAIKFVNTSPNHYIASIDFANGNKIVSDDIAFPDTINQVSVTDGELIINYVSGRTDNLGKLNAYEGVIVINSETNTTEIGNDMSVAGNFKANGTITAGGNVLSAVVANPTQETTGTLSKIKIGDTAYAVSGGTQWYIHKLTRTNGSYIEFVFPFEKNLFELAGITGKRVFGAIIDILGPSIGNIDIRATFPTFLVQSTYIQCFSLSNGNVTPTKVNYADFQEDIVTKYQVF